MINWNSYENDKVEFIDTHDNFLKIKLKGIYSYI